MYAQSELVFTTQCNNGQCEVVTWHQDEELKVCVLGYTKFRSNRMLNCYHGLHLSWLDVCVFDTVREPGVLRVVVQQHLYPPVKLSKDVWYAKEFLIRVLRSPRSEILRG